MADPAYIDADGVLTDGEAWVGITTPTIAGSAATPVVFTSTDDGQVGDFSQYLDWVLIAYVRSEASSDPYTYIMVNNTTTADGQWSQYMQGNGSAVSVNVDTWNAGKAWIWREINASMTANAFTACYCHFFDINSGKYKSMVSCSAGDTGVYDGSGYRIYFAGSTIGTQAPISSIEIPVYNGSGWSVGSMFSLFGVLPRMVS